MTADATTDARRVRTRAKLLQAMLRLLEQETFEGITVRALAAEAGVGYATFFRHYPSKEALLDDLAAGEIAGLLGKAMPLLATADSGRACVALFETLSQRKALWRALLTGGAAPLLREQFIAQARQLAANSPRAADPAASPLDLRVTFATSATIEIIGWWLRQAEELPIATIAGILDRLAIAPTLAER